MFGLKIIATIIIVLIILLGFVSSNPTVGGFFESIMDKFSGITIFETDTAQRDVFFSLEVNRYDAMSVKTRRSVNISIIPSNISVTLSSGSVKPSTGTDVYEYTGFISIDGKKISLDGKYQRFELQDNSASLDKGNIRADGLFSNLTIVDLALNELVLTNVTGKLVANEVETIFSEVDINIKSPLGKFDFNNALKIDGSAEKVSIPKRNLVIG